MVTGTERSLPSSVFTITVCGPGRSGTFLRGESPAITPSIRTWPHGVQRTERKPITGGASVDEEAAREPEPLALDGGGVGEPVAGEAGRGPEAPARGTS